MKPDRNADYCVVSFYMPMSVDPDDFLRIAACLMFNSEIAWHMIETPILTKAILKLCEDVTTRCFQQVGVHRMTEEDIKELTAWHERYLENGGEDSPGDQPTGLPPGLRIIIP